MARLGGGQGGRIWGGSGVRERLNFLEDRAEAVACDFDVVAVLEVQPEALAGSEVPGEPQCGVGADAPLAVDDLVDSSGWNPDRHRQAMLGDLEWLQILEHQHLAGVDGGHDRIVAHDGVFAWVLVVVDDLNVLGSRCRPLEADAPLLVDADAVGARPVALELLESVSRGDAQIIERLGGVEDEQLAQRGALGALVEPAHPLTPPDPLSLSVRERSQHTIPSITRSVMNGKRYAKAVDRRLLLVARMLADAKSMRTTAHDSLAGVSL